VSSFWIGKYINLFVVLLLSHKPYGKVHCVQNHLSMIMLITLCINIKRVLGMKYINYIHTYKYNDVYIWYTFYKVCGSTEAPQKRFNFHLSIKCHNFNASYSWIGIDDTNFTVNGSCLTKHHSNSKNYNICAVMMYGKSD